ncbi:MAG: hypothetical protein WCS27_14985 [Victivallaceae bacterium]
MKNVMKVKDLIEKLEKIDPQLEVLCYMENHIPAPLLIQDVSVHEAIKQKDEEEQIPRLVFQKNNFSQKIALIEITSDF